MSVENDLIVRELADCLLPPPSDHFDIQRYLVACANSARRLRKPSLYAESLIGGTTSDVTRVVPGAGGYTATTVTAHVTVEQDDPTTLNGALAARNNVQDVVLRVNNFVSRARALGLAPPSNPFVVVAQRNVGRSMFVPTGIEGQVADDVVFNVNAFLDLLDAEVAGTIDLRAVAEHSTQISSFGVSTSGFVGATGTSVGLLAFVPSSDQLKRQADVDALAALDFTRRKPRILFTADYAPTGERRGAVVGWRRMPDASGYIVTRHDVVAASDFVFRFDNQAIMARYAAVEGYVRTWVLSFYGVRSTDVWAFVDDSVRPDAVYIYTVTASQRRRVDPGFIFNVAVRTVFLPPLQLDEVRRAIEGSLSPRSRLDTAAAGIRDVRVVAPVDVGTPSLAVDDVSPYPALAKRLLGDDGLDWMLAAVNVRAAVGRHEHVDDVRSFSYLGATFSGIRRAVLDGKFVVPTDPSAIVRNVTTSVSNFGVSQTLLDVLDGTGLNFFFGEKDVLGVEPFKRAGTAPEAIGIIAGILAAVDPETATVDPRILSLNMARNVVNVSFGGARGVVPSTTTGVREIDVLDVSNRTDEQIAEDVVQALGDVGFDSQPIDLTRADGIGRFVRLLRVLFDFNPNRS